MRTFLTHTLLLSALASFFPAAAHAADSLAVVSNDPSGAWSGHYAYVAGEDFEAPPPVAFTAQLKKKGDKLSGTTEEANTFGQKTSDVLKANIEGTVKGNLVQFTKTYDGTGGQTGSIQYRGKRKANTISGTWTIAPDVKGTFEMQKNP